MPTTPYAVSSDLVSAWPAKSLAVAQFVDGYKTDLAMVQNAQTGTTYTLALTDFTKLVTLNNASAVSVTLPLESTVAWETGTQLRLLNIGAGTVTVAGAVGVTINGSPLTLGQGKGANLIKTGTNTWWFIPFASGVGAAVYSDANTGTYTGYAYKTYTASSTLTIVTAGFVDLLIQGAGGGGGAQPAYAANGGGGAGQLVLLDSVFLNVGVYTVTIGAGGSAGTGANVLAGVGNISKIGTALVASGGGSGNNGIGIGGNGANGAGTDGQYTGTYIGRAVSGGFNGGGGSALTNGGGGGGNAAVGANGAGTTGGAGGAGTSSSITGTAVTYGGGGGGGASVTGGAGGAGGGGAGGGAAQNGTAGTANTGGGGGGGNQSGSNGGPGGSGALIVRVAV